MGVEYVSDAKEDHDDCDDDCGSQEQAFYSSEDFTLCLSGPYPSFFKL